MFTPFTPYLMRAMERAHARRVEEDDRERNGTPAGAAVPGKFFREGRNVEIKARVKDLSSVILRVRAIADRDPVETVQHDTYFDSHGGLYKVRMYSRSQGEVIHYIRAGTPTARMSLYTIRPVSDPEGEIGEMSRAYDLVGRVRKTRTLYTVGNARIHLDLVDGLGPFVEIEAVLDEGESEEDGKAVVADLMKRLGIRQKDLIGESYIDLVLRG